MIGAPEPLTAGHFLGNFNSGVAALDERLRRRVHQSQASGASRTFVVLDAEQVVGYYALAASAIAPDAARGRFRRNMPDPIPVVVLGRLAISRTHQGQGLGRALFQDAARRVTHAADTIGVRGLLVHAISDEAKAFYVKLGLSQSPIDPMTLLATISELIAAQA